MRFLLTCCFAFLPSLLIAQEDELALIQRQSGVAQRYQQLEELLLRLADVEAAENPERAGLLRQAARQSRDKFVLEKLKNASDSLKSQQFQKAVDNQENAAQELKSLLTLLMSEDRSKRIRDEREWYSQLNKDLKRTLNNQRSARARAENGADLDEVTEEQQDVSERGEELLDRLKEANDEQEGGDKSAESGSEKQASGEQSQGDPSKKEEGEEEKEEKVAGNEKEEGKESKEKDEGKEKQEGQESGSKESNEDGKSGEQSESKSEQSQQSEQGEKSEQAQQSQQQQQSQQSESQQQESSNSQPQSLEQQVEQQLQKAIEKMKQAEQELEKSKRENATEKQRQAEENLRAAIDRLEQILRQLREEEMERELAKLESRLRKMAAMQTKVLDDTVALAATPIAQRNRPTDVKAGDLSFEEKKITMEADRAMLLLREEGSSVAFPEVLSQIRSDTTRVADLLAQTKIDAITQGIQQDILAALEEMIAAVQKAQRDLEKQRQQQQQGQSQPSQQGEQPLVEALAELKLIRTMETRIKSRTDRYSQLLESGDSDEDEILTLVQGDLSERQIRLYQITRDLLLKRNK